MGRFSMGNWMDDTASRLAKGQLSRRSVLKRTGAAMAGVMLLGAGPFSGFAQAKSANKGNGTKQYHTESSSDKARDGK
jgi:hypothetical protein